MKKSLVALAAFAVVGGAYAQSSVTLSGNIKGGVAQTRYTNGAAGTNGNGLSVADGSSRFLIGGTEDLGGGLKAIFQIDTRFRVDDNGGSSTAGAAGAGTLTQFSAPSQLAGGNTFVGLSGSLGMIQIGKMDTHYCLGSDQHGARATALQASSCALLGYVNGSGAGQAIANTSRSVNMIRYTTPNFAGFQAQANYSTNWQGPEGVVAVTPTSPAGSVGDAGKGRAVNLGLNYGNGPLKAGVSFWDAKSEDRRVGSARGDQKAATAFVDYNFGFLTVGLTYDQSQLEGTAATTGLTSDAKRRAWSIPVTVPLGAGTFLATYTKARDLRRSGTAFATPAAAAAAEVDTGASLWSVGYDYALSKRTSLGVSYARLNNKANAGYALYTQSSLNGTAANAVGQDASQLYLGVRHAF